jgi:chromate reductase, NAD(P)H dehydrogenase (quinone)
LNILALAGSLRAASINAAFCRAASRLAPAPMHVHVFDGMGALPLFNPDLEDDAPAAVREFRRHVDSSAALLIASPEYAHGVSGVMKNALDWLVSFEGTVNKPVALVNTSPRAHHAYDALAETLRTMSLDLVAAASITVPLLGSIVTEEAMLASPEVSALVRRMLAALSAHLAGNSRDATGRFALI